MTSRLSPVHNLHHVLLLVVFRGLCPSTIAYSIPFRDTTNFKSVFSSTVYANGSDITTAHLTDTQLSTLFSYYEPLRLDGAMFIGDIKDTLHYCTAGGGGVYYEEATRTVLHYPPIYFCGIPAAASDMFEQAQSCSNFTINHVPVACFGWNGNTTTTYTSSAETRSVKASLGDTMALIALGAYSVMSVVV